MMRILFTAIIIFHGLIHLIGFASQWHIKGFNKFTGITTFPVSEKFSKILGIVWLLAALLFILSSIGFFANKNWWLMAGLISVIISQILIIIYWKDAWGGTIGNLIILIVIIIFSSTIKFSNKINDEAAAMFSRALSSNENTVITNEMTDSLPPIVQKWMQRSGIINKHKINSVRLKQKGLMRSKPESDWLKVNAEQYFRADEPAFIYKMEVDAAPFISMTGRDRYEEGQGNMLIKILGFYTMIDSKNKEIDQGAMIRYLSESLWFPSFAISGYVKWEQINESTVKAKMVYKGMSESVFITFTPEADVKKIEAERYGEFDGKYSKEHWSVVNASYKEFEGIRIGNISEVTWKLKSGDFTWFKLEITELEYNKPFVY
jgi:NADH:ubiquinone oxidoreductase subunit K